jgi:hypothetical protein
MSSNKTQGKFVHTEDWTAEHTQLADDKELFDSLKFDGLMVDVDGQPRELRRCPACLSTFAGPPIPWHRAFAVLREQAQKFDASLDLIARAFHETPGADVAVHSVPPRSYP